MPYSVKKKNCKKSDKTSGKYVLSYVDKHGEKHNNCHTTKKGAQSQISAIEMNEDTWRVRSTATYNPYETEDNAFVEEELIESIINKLLNLET
jgi:hypothetical protein